MSNATARFLIALLRLLFPARGCQRSASTPPIASCEDDSTVALPRVPARRPELTLLRGEDVAFLRPYVLTPKECQERRLQRGRRRALWLWTHGIDAGPRWIHGVEVTG
ncbi:hypothetical protein [Streptomyces sp. GS7]|uniref:hypothetical protein n=1 Tax=Streptomyces sp. GS7 TaxID=2692234 RepID=UPI001318F77E|nr:hypothetical protein [Streptomyces sp. GS7]QHC24940.1 hypothetical protein GR130_29785 [Streptomyces sp. GS7]